MVAILRVSESACRSRQRSSSRPTLPQVSRSGSSQNGTIARPPSFSPTSTDAGIPAGELFFLSRYTPAGSGNVSTNTAGNTTIVTSRERSDTSNGIWHVGEKVGRDPKE